MSTPVIGREGLLRLVEWAGAAAGTRSGGKGRRRGHPPQMTALTKVPETELWTSFPEATRNDILGLLSMLLERLAVSPRPAAEGTGGEHGASA